MRALVLALLVLVGALPAAAHTASRSFSAWTIADTRAEGVFETDARRATQLIDIEDGATLPALFARHVTRTVTLRQGDVTCTAAPARPEAAETGMVRARIIFTCPAPIISTASELTIRMFDGISPGHVHYVRVDGGPEPIEAALSAQRPSLVLGQASPSTITGFITEGALHVLGGLDHLAFIAALALLAGRPWGAALAATGFTIGHSITLALVVFGIVTPNEAAVEMLIGFTIAFAAAEALGLSGSMPRALAAGAFVLACVFAATLLGFRPPPLATYAGLAVFAVCAGMMPATTVRQATPVLAALFGLVHGAGFAGALQVLHLPPERIAPALFGFNVGVELGQLLALAVLGAVAWVISRLPHAWRPLLRDAAAATLLALGMFWFAQRTFISL